MYKTGLWQFTLHKLSCFIQVFKNMNVVAIAFIPCNFQDKVPKQFFSKYLESSLEILYLLILSTENKTKCFLK